jgi:programmed cell death protein 5
MSEDSELAAIKAARLAQLKAQAGGRSPSSIGGPQNGQDSEDSARQRQEEEQMRRDMLATLLDPAARERRESSAPTIPSRADRGTMS